MKISHYKINKLLASSLCTQQNINEEEAYQNETINLKDQIQQLIEKYVQPHLKKVGKIHLQIKGKRNFIVPHVTIMGKSQPT